MLTYIGPDVITYTALVQLCLMNKSRIVSIIDTDLYRFVCMFVSLDYEYTLWLSTDTCSGDVTCYSIQHIHLRFSVHNLLCTVLPLEKGASWSTRIVYLIHSTIADRTPR